MLQPSSRPGNRNSLLWITLGLLLIALGVRAFRSTALAGELEARIPLLASLDKGDTSQPNLVLFYGASSVAYWGSLASDMKPLHVANHAFGGAEYTDLIERVDEDVIRYHPVAVVVYAGDNDLASPTHKTPQSVTNDVRQFVQIVHAQLPDTWVYILSIKPSYARWNDWPNMKAADQLIQAYAATQDRTEFLDVATPMFDSNGKLPRDLFVFDGLHPSAKCYVIWTSVIKPVLLKRFGPEAQAAAAQ